MERKRQAFELSRVWERRSFVEARANYLELARSYSRIPDHREAAVCLREAARLSIAIGDPQAAVSILQRSLDLEREQKNIEGEGETLAFLSSVHTSIGNFQSGEKYLIDAVRSLDRVRDKNSRANVSYYLGETYYSREDTPNFIKYYESSLQQFRESGDDVGEAKAMLALSYAYLPKGEVGKGLFFAREAVKKYEAIGDARGRVLSTVSLGFLLFKAGEPRNAMDSFQLALSQFSKDLDRSEKAVLIYNFGRVQEFLGECGNMISFYRQALDLFKADQNISLSVGTLWTLGKALNSCGREDEAVPYLNEALRLGLSAKKHHDVIAANVELAKLGAKHGNFTQAEKYYHNALKVLERSDYILSRSQVYRGLGNLYLQQGRPDLSRPYFQRTLELDRSNSDRFDEADSLYNLATLDRIEGRAASALEYSEESLRITESLSGDVVNSRLKGSFVSNVFDRYELHISLLMNLHRESGDAQFAIRALQTAERARARSMLESLALSEANILKDAVPEDVEREKEIRTLLNHKADMLTEILSRNGDPAEAKKVEDEISELRGRQEELRAELKRKSPQYAAVRDPRPFNVTEFQSRVLDDDSVLLEFSLGKTESYLWLVGKTEVAQYVLPPRWRIESRIEKLRGLLIQKEKKPEEVIDAFQKRVADSEAEYAREARLLSDELLGQAADKIAGKRLIVVADGKLLYFPLSALPVPNSASDEPILLENEVAYEPSASALVLIKDNAAGNVTAQRDLFMISDPVFSNSDARLGQNGGTAARLLSAITGNFRSFETLGSLSRLPASAEEADSITDVVGAGATTTITGFAANRESVLNEAASDYRVIHFATHGLVDEMRPDLSGIVLSLFDEAGNRKDGGFLRLQDVYGMNLNADLVVLSACDTGLGKEIKGEGLISLNNAFLQAGSKSVVSSLWKVEDTATKELMTEFYRGMASEGLTASEALRRAKIRLRNDPRFRSPFYWASFTLQGDIDVAPKFSRGRARWLYLLGVLPFLLGGLYLLLKAGRR